MNRKKIYNNKLDMKVAEFTTAIEKYNTFSKYTEIERLLAITVVILQVLTSINLIQSYHFNGFISIISVLILTYIATDFFNGLVHMIIDNNTSYNTIVGPFIAAFHMHHHIMKYKEKHPINIYFTESGHKFWLVVYLIFLALIQKYCTLNANLNLGLVAFGILSSFAEVSHYWCHNSVKKKNLITFLQKYRILLSLKHHRLHHINDNVNYAFLNGVSDPLLNLIARTFYQGYKNHSDQHVTTYINELKKELTF